jgi:nucleoside-triphosphatase THEP1
MRLRDVATGQSFMMCLDGEGPAADCHLDHERFEQASNRLLALCETDADLLFVSRFGKMEARGRGFRAAIAKAVERRLPVLTAVRRGLVPNWFEFTGGTGTLLDARLWVLRQWWREIAPLRS